MSHVVIVVLTIAAIIVATVAALMVMITMAVVQKVKSSHTVMQATIDVLDARYKLADAKSHLHEKLLSVVSKELRAVEQSIQDDLEIKEKELSDMFARRQ